MRENSAAIGWLHEKPPTSVPKTIFTPALSAFWNDGPWTSARLRSRCPAGVPSGAHPS